MIDYLEHIREDSARFAEMISAVSPSGEVPSCPGWSVADLAWHLTQVQHFWASIVADLLQSPDTVRDLARPEDDQLPALFAAQSLRLATALRSHPPETPCWSWHEDGRSVGWVRRRQAHEALIHRVDAELAAGAATVVNPELANDGVDEILGVMIDATGIPDWSSFTADGRTAALIAVDGSRWAVELGRFTGTSPRTGTTYDDPALRLLDTIPAQSSVTVLSSGVDLDLWLWGRRDLDSGSVTGDAASAAYVRAAAAAGTQ